MILIIWKKHDYLNIGTLHFKIIEFENTAKIEDAAKPNRDKNIFI